MVNLGDGFSGSISTGGRQFHMLLPFREYLVVISPHKVKIASEYVHIDTKDSIK